ncbi:MAG: hypothetical protein GXW99_05790 [Clostridiales bacterium]|nr:hypothetical protein [Clostridiales bacterium]
MPNRMAGDATKELLCQSLKKKMAVKPLDKISIREITEDCGLNRQTFYYHFEDIYDQVKWMYEQEAISLLREHESILFWQEGILLLFAYLEKNRAVCLCSLRSMGHDHVRRLFYNDLHDILKNLVFSMGEQAHIPEDYGNFLTHYFTVSLAAMVESWLLGEIKETPEQLVAYVDMTINDQLRGAVARASSQEKSS